MPLFGAHMSIAGGYCNALIAARDHGCDSVQLFTKSPSQWAAKPISKSEATQFRRTCREFGIRLPVGHDSYLINLASPDDALFRRSVEAFVDEVRRANQLGLRYLVTHPGAHMGAGEPAGLRRVAQALDEVHDRCPTARVRILLETTAGQGTCLGGRFEHLRDILRQVRNSRRLGVCLDTCHVVAAGYALDPDAEYKATFRAFGRLIGCRRIKVFHVNDSAKPLGSRVDRHAHLGKGHVGLGAFRRLVGDPRFADRPMILETPKETAGNSDMDTVNLNLLRRGISTAVL